MIPVLLFLFCKLTYKLSTFINYIYLFNYPLLITLFTLFFIIFFIIREKDVTLYKGIELSSYICLLLFFVSLIGAVKYIDIQNIAYNLRYNNFIIAGLKYGIVGIIPSLLITCLNDIKIEKDNL